jgi:hypothetical protein
MTQTQEIESLWTPPASIPDSVPAKGRARLLDPSKCDGPDCSHPPTRALPSLFGMGKFCDQCASCLAALVVNANEHDHPTPEGQAALRKIGWK